MRLTRGFSLYKVIHWRLALIQPGIRDRPNENDQDRPRGQDTLVMGQGQAAGARLAYLDVA